MTTVQTTEWVVWLDTRDRVASFHPVEGSAVKQFRNHDYFLEFLTNLQCQGYRFQ